MNSIVRCALPAILVFALGACASRSIFYWGDYETAIHDRLVENNGNAGEQNLIQTITAAEQSGKKVAPGLYADYGFMLYRRGNLEGAILYFDKERKTFPEATLLMGKLIDKIREKQDPVPRSETPNTPEAQEKP